MGVAALLLGATVRHATAWAPPVITSISAGATTLSVKFTAVSGDVTHYSVRVYHANRLVASSTTCAPSACVINGLHPTTAYAVSVAAHGPGQRSTAESARTSCTTISLALASAAPEAGWRILVRSPLGVLVDQRNLSVDGLTFVAVRFRYATTAFHLHVGSADPPGAAALAPGDAASRVSAQELALGVIGVFNSGFQASDHAGGVMMDGRVYEPLVPGDATLAVTRTGHVVVGTWGRDLPRANVAAIAYRQNLSLMVDGGRTTALAATPYWGTWGGAWHLNPHEPRSGLGIDARGNVLYVATSQGAMPLELARALAASGAREGMELDMNPYWPTLGVADLARSRHPQFVYTLPGELKDPTTYFAGSTRDFVVAVAQPALGSCAVTSAPPTTHPQPEPLTLSGVGCTPSR